MTNVTILQQKLVGQPSPIEAKLDRLISASFNGLREEFGDLTIYADRAPTELGRQALNARVDELRRGLDGATDIDIRKVMVKLSSALVPRVPEGQQDRATMREVAFAVLGDCPAWALEAACTAFMRGEAGDGHWMPTPAEIRQAAKRRMQRHEDELAKIEKILTARVIKAPDGPIRAKPRPSTPDQPMEQAAS